MVTKLMERETRMVAALGVEANGTTAVNAIAIPANYEVEKVWVRSAKAGTGAANLTVGDEDDADGYILAADHTAAVGTIYGDAIAEVGAYQFTIDGTVEVWNAAKKYTAAKNIKIVLSAAGTIQSKWDVYASMTPFPVSP